MNPLEDLARGLAAALEADERPPCTYPDTGHDYARGKRP